MYNYSVGASLNDAGKVVYEWNDDGPVYGPNGEWELDPNNDQCRATRPVFATCKNTCPGGESVVSSQYFVIYVSVDNY